MSGKLATIPVIGQPTLMAVVPTVLAQCPCEAHTILLFSGIGATLGCAACERAWVLQGAAVTPHGTEAHLLPVSVKERN